jgi:signal peptidase
MSTMKNTSKKAANNPSKQSKKHTKKKIVKNNKASSKSASTLNKKRKKNDIHRTSKGKKTKKVSNRRKKKNTDGKMAKVIRLFFDIFFFVMILFMLIGAAIFTISDKTDKSFYGYRFYEVLTNSMKKTEKGQKGNFVAGDMVIVKVGNVEDIKTGDIITFVPNKESKETYLTHRVINKKPAEPKIKQLSNGKTKIVDNFPVFQTQGDANNAPDPPVSGEMVIGVVKLALPKAGTIINFMRSNLIATLVFVVAFFLLVGVIRGYFAKEPEPVRKKKAKRSKKNRI